MVSHDFKRLTTSVIIPTYNRAALVSEAIHSALRQTRVPDEIVVVDDGSTDGTDRVLSGFGPPVTVIRQANKGRSAARNAGLRAARGDLLVFLDSDDLLVEDSIERRARILETEPEVDVVYGDMILVNSAGERMGLHRDYMPGRRPSGHILGELALRCFVLMPAMVRRRAIADLTFDESLHQAEDYDLWRRLAARSQFRFVEGPIAVYRLHDANTITNQQRQMLESELEVQSRFFAMSEFQLLSIHQRARAYRAHGAKCVVAGHRRAARRSFVDAVRTAPLSPAGHGLLLISVFSPYVLRRLILARRRITRQQLRMKGPPEVSETRAPSLAQGNMATS